MPTSTRILMMIAAALLSLGAVGLALGDDDEDDEARGGWLRPRADVAPVTNETYVRECGSCHMAYQPGLLPGDAWILIMQPTSLASHFGDDASLSEDLRAEIASYLKANSADRAGRSRSRAFAVAARPDAAGQGTGLPRITRTRYFLHEHDEIPPRLVIGNPDVGSFSQCDSCHRGAADGVYNEKQVSVPGHGRWED